MEAVCNTSVIPTTACISNAACPFGQAVYAIADVRAIRVPAQVPVGGTHATSGRTLCLTGAFSGLLFLGLSRIIESPPSLSALRRYGATVSTRPFQG